MKEILDLAFRLCWEQKILPENGLAQLSSVLSQMTDSGSVAMTARFIEYPLRLESYRWFQGINEELGLKLFRAHVESIMGSEHGLGEHEFYVISSWKEFFELLPQSYWWWVWPVKIGRREKSSVPNTLYAKYYQRLIELSRLAYQRGTEIVDEETVVVDYGGCDPIVDVIYSVEAVTVDRTSEWKKSVDRRIQKSINAQVPIEVIDDIDRQFSDMTPPEEPKTPELYDWESAVSDWPWSVVSSYLEPAGEWYVASGVQPNDPFAPIDLLFALGGFPIGPVGTRWVLFNPED